MQIQSDAEESDELRETLSEVFFSLDRFQLPFYTTPSTEKSAKTVITTIVFN